MAEKSFGVKEINLIGASGTPTIESPNNLNLNAVNVAISTNATIGGTLSVTGNVSVGGTLTYEDVTNIDSVGVITARSNVVVGGGISAVGISTFNSVVKIGSDLQILKSGSQDVIASTNDAIDIQNDTYVIIGQNTHPNNNYAAFSNAGAQFYRSGNQTLRDNSSGWTFYNHIIPNTDSQYDLGTNSVRFRNVYADTLYGDASNLTGIAVTEAPVTNFTISGNSPNYYIHGGGVDGSAGNPDLYLIRGHKYRFNNTTGTGHPFRFRTKNINVGGQTYSDGVSGSESGIQFFTVPVDAPASLVYQCTIHQSMVGNIHIRGADGDGIANTGSVGVQTANITDPDLVGAASSLVGLYIGDGSLLFSDQLARSGGYYITTGVNALNAGPVTLNSEMKLDGTWTIV